MQAFMSARSNQTVSANTAEKSQNTFRLPFLFMGTGLFLFIGFNLLSLLDINFYFNESIRLPYGWSLAHLGVLGWASMIAMGAIYQLLQVVLQRQVYSERLGNLHFALYITGVIGMVYSFFQFDIKLLSWSASFTAAGICLFATNILITIGQAKKWNSITTAVAISITALFLTAATGTFMGLDFGLGFLGEAHLQLLHTHIWLGVMGWFGLLIVGFSFKLLPMFLLSHNYSQRSEPWIVGCIALGMVGMAVFLLFNLSTVLLWLCLLLVAIGFGLYWLHVENMNKHRHKANPGSGIISAIWVVRATAIFFLLVTAALGLFPTLWKNDFFIRGAFYFYLLLWVNGSVLCYMSKIVPFLWWTYRYSSQMGKPGVPALAQFLKEKSFSLVLRILLVAHLLFGINLMFGMIPLQGPLQILISALSMIYATQLALVFRR